MQSIAKRIEERCLERESERRALALAHGDRQEVDDALQELREAHRAARIAFLGELRKAQGAELEVHLLHVEKRKRIKENRRWVEQDSLDGERLQDMMSSWRCEQRTMAAAVVKRESYLLRLRGTIETHQSAKMNRQRKKELLKEHSDALTLRCDQMIDDADRAKDEIKLLEEEDAARKAHVQHVADQVRSQLAKVRVLSNVRRSSVFSKIVASHSLHASSWLVRTCHANRSAPNCGAPIEKPNSCIGRPANFPRPAMPNSWDGCYDLMEGLRPPRTSHCRTRMQRTIAAPPATGWLMTWGQPPAYVA